MVFAHYMVTNQDYQADNDPAQELKIAAYEREIQQAQAMGIDGFALNVGGWLHEHYYIRYTAQMFEAAYRLHSGFVLMFSADMCCGNSADDVEDMVRRFANNPRYAAVYYRYQGKAVLTTFAGDKLGPKAWKDIRADLKSSAHPSLQSVAEVLTYASGSPDNRPLNVFFVPAFFWGGETPRTSHIQSGFDTWKSTIDGAFYWGIAGVPGSGGILDQVASSESYGKVLHRAGKLYMAPVCLQFWGANANRYYEYSGAAGMRSMWMSAIKTSHPEWVEIITWNDFIEGSYVSPIDDPNQYTGANFLTSSGVPLNTTGYFHSHAGASELLKFFIEWYKTGKEPVIEHDSVFYFYRTQPKATAAPIPAVSNVYGPLEDSIYITANLTAPADLAVTTAAGVVHLKLPAGSSDTQTPFTAGPAPTFTLRRNQHVLTQGTGADAITATPRYKDYYYSTGVISARTRN